MVTRSNFKGKPCEWSWCFWISVSHLSICCEDEGPFQGRIYALYIWSQVFLLAALWVGDFYSHFTNNETISKKDLKSFTQDQVGKLDFEVHTLSSVSFCVFLVGTLTTACKLTRLFPLFKGNHPRLKYEIVFDPSSQLFHQHLLSTYYKLGIDIKNK